MLMAPTVGIHIEDMNKRVIRQEAGHKRVLVRRVAAIVQVELWKAYIKERLKLDFRS